MVKQLSSIVPVGNHLYSCKILGSEERQVLLGPEPDIHKAAWIVDAVMEGGDYAFVKFVEALDESEQFTAASLIQKGGIITCHMCISQLINFDPMQQPYKSTSFRKSTLWTHKMIA